MRKSIKHLDSEAIEWEEILNTGAMRKVFNTNDINGSDTSLVKLPPGWKGPAGAHYHSDYEEALVLTGDVDLNGNDLLVAGSYLYRPGGIVHGFVDNSPSGSDIIIKMGTSTDLISVNKPLHSYEYPEPKALVPDGREHILHLRTNEEKWIPLSNDEICMSYKVLSHDKDNGAQTLLMSVPQNYSGATMFKDNFNWEIVVIDGDIEIGDTGVFKKYSYTFRPSGSGSFRIDSSINGATLMAWRD